MTGYHCELAWLGGARAGADVLVEVNGSRIEAVTPGVAAPPGAVRLAGLTLPGFANAHSHAFHRVLRGRTETGAEDFFAWRSLMYRAAERLDPPGYLALARAAYAEMALAGVTAVGEFHYLHHEPGGRPYAEPNEMALALVSAAAQAGVRLTLLDCCYLQADLSGTPLSGAQLRFGDPDVTAWQNRLAGLVAALAGQPHAAAGAAVHSVRAVPPQDAGRVAATARRLGVPLHVHLSEQPAENAACRAATGRSPTGVLAGAGVLGPTTTAVHATHLDPADIALLGRSGTTVCLCPSTEAELADGVGPAPALARAGCRLCLGTDSHAAVDLLAEGRAVELHERLVSGRRGHHHPEQLLAAATGNGMAALGWPAGRIAPGELADLVTLRTDSVRLAGADPDSAVALAVFAATAADVDSVICAGRAVVAGGRHLLVADVPGQLAAAVRAVLG